MDNDKHLELEYCFIIADRKKKDDLSAALHELGARIVDIIYAKGSLNVGTPLQEAFGFVAEEQKVIITCLLPGKKAALLIERLNTDFHFCKPNTGIAYTVPVEGISF